MGSCRVCVVDVKDMATSWRLLREGLGRYGGRDELPRIRQARRDILELLLDNHPKDCQTCERDGNCELQNLAYSLGVRERLFEVSASTSTRMTPATPSSARLTSASCAAGVCAFAPRCRGFTISASTGAASRPSSARPTGEDGRVRLHPVRPVHQRLPDGRIS